MATAKGLMRFPAFMRNLFAAIRSEQHSRVSAGEPSLFYAEMRYSDLALLAFFTLLIFSIRMLTQKKLAHVLFPSYSRKMKAKLSENLFYTVYYTIAFAYFCFFVYPQTEWNINLFSNHSDVVSDFLYPFPPKFSEIERFYYAQTGGFYLAASIFLLFFDIRRSDFNELLLHHFVTLSMVVLSYLYGYVRVGMTVVMLHDIGDIFLYSAKLVHHLGFRGLDTAIFAVFAVTFYVTRLVMYSRVVHAIVVGTISRLTEVPSYNRWAKFYDTYLVHYVFFVIALSTLLWLHCFWYGLILKLIYREVVLGKKISDEGDIRSDNEDEDELDAFENDDVDTIDNATLKKTR